jgi:hypothetical protein
MRDSHKTTYRFGQQGWHCYWSTNYQYSRQHRLIIKSFHNFSNLPYSFTLAGINVIVLVSHRRGTEQRDSVCLEVLNTISTLTSTFILEYLGMPLIAYWSLYQ